MALNGRKINSDFLGLGSWRRYRVTFTTDLQSIEDLIAVALNPATRAIRIRNLGSVTVYAVNALATVLPEGAEIRAGETEIITGSVSCFDNSLDAPDKSYFGTASGTSVGSIEVFG